MFWSMAKNTAEAHVLLCLSNGILILDTLSRYQLSVNYYCDQSLQAYMYVFDI